MQNRVIGDRTVSAIGLGAMELSVDGRPERAASIATVHASLDAGVRLIDTADAYCLSSVDVGHNEALVADALRAWPGERDEVLIATKGGHTRGPNGDWAVNGHPDYLRTACEASLRQLDVEAIGLYQFHRPDPAVPYADSVGAIKELRDEGKIVLAGVSNANVEQIRLAAEILGDGGLASVQNEFSPRFLSSMDELLLCGELGVAFLPWSPLGGMGDASTLGERFPAFLAVAQQRGVSAQQIALAWELALGGHVIPIPGCTRPFTAQSSAAAADLVLTADEMALLTVS